MSIFVVDFWDIDGDGDLDFFVGEWIKVGKYGVKCLGFILENDGVGNFCDVIVQYYFELFNIGMIISVWWCDFNNDVFLDLVVAGEFMEVQILINEGLSLCRQLLFFFNVGFWMVLEVVDLDGDGNEDLVFGNLGINSCICGIVEYLLCLYYNDFDNNNFLESILIFNVDNGKDYFYVLWYNFIKQMLYFKK